MISSIDEKQLSISGVQNHQPLPPPTIIIKKEDKKDRKKNYLMKTQWSC